MVVIRSVTSLPMGILTLASLAQDDEVEIMLRVYFLVDIFIMITTCLE